LFWCSQQYPDGGARFQDGAAKLLKIASQLFEIRFLCSKFEFLRRRSSFPGSYAACRALKGVSEASRRARAGALDVRQ
jgi:hypothetical protein